MATSDRCGHPTQRRAAKVLEKQRKRLWRQRLKDEKELWDSSRSPATETVTRPGQDGSRFSPIIRLTLKEPGRKICRQW
jgi:hypothetical protein